MRSENISMLNDTLRILDDGEYVCRASRRIVHLKLSGDEMRDIRVYLPEDVKKIEESTGVKHTGSMFGRISVSCVNRDSFTCALENEARHKEWSSEPLKQLVLNFANPVHPGGGVRHGATAQEEDLCRRSSLLLSLESPAAGAYYRYNASLHTMMASDAMMITPKVEIIKDEKGETLPESVVVSVMTCAAPMIRDGLVGLPEEEYRDLFYNRIVRILKVAAYLGYRKLVLGAFGCGAFRNDAKLVSDLFYKALKEFNYAGGEARDYFTGIDFAVLDHSPDQYNYKEFSRNFSNFYRDEDAAEERRVKAEMKAEEDKLDQIRGSMIGGAIGDALGYPIEFLSEEEIFGHYGPAGLTSYQLTGGKALISDDTQMTLFTANGILIGDTRGMLRGIAGPPRIYVVRAYLDWLKTQTSDYETVNKVERYTRGGGTCWLLDVPELYARRAPGNTCLSALEMLAKSESADDYCKNPINDSKGCGGVMRIAPLPLAYRNFLDQKQLDLEAAQLAAITHGHSLGYMPAAVICHIISGILSSYPEKSLKDIVLDAGKTARKLFKKDPHLNDLIGILDQAVTLSENDHSDLDNIHALGEGWVAEETMAIAIYCALRHPTDFSAAVMAAVNHGGDSDSTGAVTGNIVGAMVGYDAIDEKWKKDLELRDVILEMADDICHGCHMSEYSSYKDPAWEAKYVRMHRYHGQTYER